MLYLVYRRVSQFVSSYQTCIWANCLAVLISIFQEHNFPELKIIIRKINNLYSRLKRKKVLTMWKWYKIVCVNDSIFSSLFFLVKTVGIFPCGNVDRRSLSKWKIDIDWIFFHCWWTKEKTTFICNSISTTSVNTVLLNLFFNCLYLSPV